MSYKYRGKVSPVGDAFDEVEQEWSKITPRRYGTELERLLWKDRERERLRTKRANETPEEEEARKAKRREYGRKYRAKIKATETPEQAEERRRKRRERQRRYVKNMSSEQRARYLQHRNETRRERKKSNGLPA